MYSAIGVDAARNRCGQGRLTFQIPYIFKQIKGKHLTALFLFSRILCKPFGWRHDNELTIREKHKLKMSTVSPAKILYIVNGTIKRRHRQLFTKKIPVTIRASDAGVSFLLQEQHLSSNVVPYVEFESATIRNFLWIKKIVITTQAGSESIRCAESSKNIGNYPLQASDASGTRIPA